MNHSRYTQSDNQVSEISLKDLARRSKYGGVFYLLAFWGSVFSSVSARQHLDIIGVFSGCFLLLQIYRLVLFFKVFSAEKVSIKSSYEHFALLYNASAVVWVSSSAWLYYVNPSIDLAVTVNAMAAAGISIGGVTVLAPAYSILRSYCLLICLPYALAAACLLDGPGNWIVTCLILAYGLFIFITAKQQNRAYWQALNDNQALAEQAQELEKAKIEAELAGQAKADFLAAMTHEIRTPMNGVLGMAQLLSMGNLDEKQRQQVTVINNAGRTLLHIINNILDYSKINAEQLVLEKRCFSVRDLVNEVILLLSPQVDKKAINFTSRFDDVPELIEGDPYRLHQILYNLVGNALKFTDQGEISLEVFSAQGEDDNRVIMSFVITDSGIGISPEDQPHIFEQFYQVNQFNPNIRGTGLGLSITQRIVELMGGTITVESQLGVGSVFSVILPFTLAVNQTEGESGAENLVSSPERQRVLQVLLVEDNRINQTICEQLLGQLGCQVEVAQSGVIALQKYRRHQHYDVIFMDCNMPEMDGFSATKAIRQIELDKQLDAIPIVALTAHVEEEIKQKCLHAGMNAFLSKPFLFEELAAIINGVRMKEIS